MKKEFSLKDEPRFELPDDEIRRYQNFVTPFNVMPEPFDSPKALSDYAMIFTAASAVQVEFVQADDNMSSYVSLSKIKSRSAHAP